MNIKNILSIMLVKYENDDKISTKILKEIQETILEIEVAEAMFNTVSDPKLIEAAIYREDYAKKKFDYLLSMAKDQKEIEENIQVEIEKSEKIEI